MRRKPTWWSLAASAIWIGILFVALHLEAGMVLAGQNTNYWGLLKPVAVFSELRAAALAKGIQVEGVDLPGETNVLSPGDDVTMLIDLHEKRRLEMQWLICFQAVAGSNNAPSTTNDPTVLYTCTGQRFEFGNLPASLHIRTIGPVVSPESKRSQPRLADNSAVISVNQDFLGLGLDRATAALKRLYDSRRLLKGNFDFNYGISSEAFKSAEIKRGQKMAALLHFTPAEERSLAGGVPVMFSYFNTVQQTPELDSIMFKVISLPSVWSLVGNLGISPDIGIGRPIDRVGVIALPDWNLPSHSPFYTMPVDVWLNKHPALRLTLIVTEPRPPLLICGGIVGFLAENPEDRDNYLTLRVISAHGGTGRLRDTTLVN